MQYEPKNNLLLNSLTSGCDTMTEVDLTSLGSYTELPGGNIRLPRGYTSILGPIVSGISEGCILKGHPVKHIHWRYRAEMEEIKNDKVQNVKKYISIIILFCFCNKL